MSKPFNNDEDLISAVQQLPRSMKAPEKIWSGIASRLNDRSSTDTESGRPGAGWKKGRRNQAIAASLVLAFVAGMLSGRQIGIDESPIIEAPFPDLAMQASLEATEREYVAAFKEFIPVGTAKSVLTNQAVVSIEESWAELLQAETALLAALREYPENIYLNQKLLDLRSQQLGFMKQLAMLDQFSRRKI